jgi:2-keto-4-pentenoate hydratase/2-oxohepta-3-ene-1,7-dioic acid hydratase in catechol pathway
VKCQVRVNGASWLRDGEAAMAYYTWGEIVQRASKDSRIAPGDIIGSGTVGGGSIREAIRKGYEEARWLEPGDVVELEVDGIGALNNTIGPRTADPAYPFLPKSPTATPERSTHRDYRYELTRS